MNKNINLKTLLAAPGNTLDRQLSLFAIVSLGVLESLSNGLMSAADSVRYFFNAENCLFVHQILGETIAEEVMSHGVQLPDLFDVLPTEKAQHEFNRELATIRSLCLQLLAEERLAA